MDGWTDFQRKKLCFFFSFFLKNLILPAERRRYLKNKNRKKPKKMDGFSTQKRAIFGRIFNSTAYIYIYITRTAGFLMGPEGPVLTDYGKKDGKSTGGSMSL